MRKILSSVFIFAALFFMSCANNLSGSVSMRTPNVLAPYGTNATDNSKQSYHYVIELDGPTNVTLEVDSGEEVFIDGLIAGDYIVSCKALVDDEVRFFGQTKATVEIGKTKSVPLKLEIHNHASNGKYFCDENSHWELCECGKVVNKADHSWGNGTITKSATCTEDGVKTFLCNGCKKEKVETIKSNGHDLQLNGDFFECICGLKAETLDSLGTYKSTGDGKCTFGVYPQTIKANTVTVDKTVKNSEISGVDYYLGSDGGWYAECEENAYSQGSSYTKYYSYSDGSYAARKNLNNPKILYFKVEPIEWVNLNTTGCLVATKILTAMEYYPYKNVNRTIDGSTVYPNNYKHSKVRAFLNGLSYVEKSSDDALQSDNSDFKDKGLLQVAFTKKQSDKITEVKVDNSLTSIGYSSSDYVCEDTSDKLYLLSYKELFSDNGLDVNAKLRGPTDYALANYVFVSSNCNSNWCMRSPASSDSSVRSVFNSGLAYAPICEDISFGVVPALKLYEGN